MKKNQNQSWAWAREAGRRLDALRAKRVEEIATRCARARARKLEALESRKVDLSTEAELVGIYRAACCRALARSNHVIDLNRIYNRRKRGRRNPYPFTVRLAWIRELWRAAREARAEIYRTHKISDETATMADLVQLRDLWQGNWGEVRTSEIVESPVLAVTGRDRGHKTVNGRELHHARECLSAHWALSGSSRWQSALQGDYNLLAACVRVARGEGHAALGAWDNWHNSAQRRAVLRLKERIASGDALLTSQPERAQSALDALHGVKTATKRAVRASLAASNADYLMIS